MEIEHQDKDRGGWLDDAAPLRRPDGELLVDAAFLAGVACEVPPGGHLTEHGRVRDDEGKLRPLMPLVNASAHADPLAQVLAAEAADEAVIPDAEMLARRMLRTLPQMERAVLRMRFGIGGQALTQDQTSARLGVSRKTVHNVERRALKRLRTSVVTGVVPLGQVA